MTFTFPQGLLDDTETIFGLLGTFWQQLYQGRDVGWGICRGKAESERQTYQDALEAANALSCEKCPILHTALWHPLILREDERQIGNPLKYGDPGVVYGVQPGGGTTYLYNSGNLDGAVAWGLSDAGAGQLRECRVLTAGIAAPTVILTEGVEFAIDRDDKLLVLRDDPFQHPLIPQETADDGVTTVTLWAFRGGYDWALVQNQYGYALGLEVEDSSTAYRELIDAILDGLVSGPSLATVARAFATLTDTPLAAGNETVEEVTTDHTHLLILTDQNVYRYKKTSTALVDAGDVLRAGQALVDTVLIEQPNGNVPANLSDLEVPADFFTGITTGPLTFENTDKALTILTDVDAKTKLTWDLGGASSDVDAFFTRLHANGVAADKTLANYLDRRPVEAQTTEPTADNLPATINPLKLLFEHVFRGNLLLVRVRQDQFGPNALGLSHQWVIRKILPPHLAVIVVVTGD